MFLRRYDYDPEQFAGNQLPVLVIGTKADQAETIREKALSRVSSVAEECGADQFNLVSQLSWVGGGWRTWCRVGILRLYGRRHYPGSPQWLKNVDLTSLIW